MKITAKKYAQALLESVEGKSKKEAEEQIKKLIALMYENGDMKQGDKLVDEFVSCWDKVHGITEVEVTTASELNSSSKKSIEKYAKTKFKSEKIEMTEKVDEKILGGVVLRSEDKVYDASVKTRLYELKKSLNK